jgi:hypothetical protein
VSGQELRRGLDDEASKASARRLAESVRAALDSDRQSEAIALFMTEAGLPPDIVDEMSQDPALISLAPTMVHDHAVMDDFDRGGTIPEALARTVQTTSLVLTGTQSPDFFRIAAERIEVLLPNGKLSVLEGADHSAPPSIVAPVVLDFLATAVRSTL